jgi:RNA polymerase sigma-70 factor, ECF subfamily
MVLGYVYESRERELVGVGVTNEKARIEHETELIRRAQAQDTHAFCLLAEQYSRRIYLLAFHYCHNTQDAEDLSQEVWLKAYEAISSFRFDSSFYTWLRRITVNTFLNYRRANSFQRHGETTQVQMLPIDAEGGEVLDGRVISEETIYNKVLLEAVRSALAALTSKQRLVFLLRHYEGLSYEEIANAMNCSTGTAKKAVWRALGKVRINLDVPSRGTTEGVAQLVTEY